MFLARRGLFVYAELDYRIHFEAAMECDAGLFRCMLCLHFVCMICFGIGADFFVP